MTSSHARDRRSPGRPSASTHDRRQQIQDAASALFADLGYERTTIRAVAELADVDPKLVMHYFGTKEQLFVSTVQIPQEVGVALGLLKLTPRSTWGKRIADVLWRGRNGSMMRTLTGVIRAASSEPKAAEMFREFYLTNMMVPHLANLDVSDRELRAIMMSTLMAGWVFTNNIVGITALSSASERKRKKLFAALIQQILTSEL